MGGQGPKKFSTKRSYNRYIKRVDSALQGEDIANAAKTLAPLIGAVTGYDQVAPVISAIADAYISYKKDGDAAKAAYEGAKTYIKETTPGMIASESISKIEKSGGVKFDSSTKDSLNYALTKVISKAEDEIFKKIEGK